MPDVDRRWWTGRLRVAGEVVGVDAFDVHLGRLVQVLVMVQQLHYSS